MSWDIIVFNLNKKITEVAEIDESILVDIGTGDDLKRIIAASFPNLICDTGNWCKIETDEYSVEFSAGDESATFSNLLVHLYGEKAIYIIVELCKINNWQAYDTSLGTMLNLEKPAENGYLDFQEYLNQVKQGS